MCSIDNEGGGPAAASSASNNTMVCDSSGQAVGNIVGGISAAVGTFILAKNGMTNVTTAVNSGPLSHVPQEEAVNVASQMQRANGADTVR